MRIHVFVVVVGIFQVAYAWQNIATAEHYNNSLILDTEGNYLLFWNFNSTHVTFEVRVKTRGYVGFGLSPNGKMFPADVVVGWVKDGNVYFKDCHTTGHSPPTADKSQDWFLLHGEENDFGTVLKFVRKINTCDQDDLQINNATQRVIYSYHPDDPADEDSIMYHGGERRGTKSVALLNVNKPPEVVASEEIHTYDFTAGNYLIPDKDTTYLCVAHQMPDLGRKHHMIQFEPILTPGNEHLVHHLTIQRCPGKHQLLHGSKAECFGDWPNGWPDCPEIFLAWATGGGSFYFLQHAGYPVSGSDDFSFYVMQIHYDNPSLKPGVIDNSGIRMRITSTLRQHDVGSLIVGHMVLPLQVIPPHESAFVSSGYCAEQCIDFGLEQIQVDEIKVIAVFQHAHLLASGIKTRHFRNGTELPPVYDDPHYDFYFQEFRSLQKEVVIKKGDRMTAECTYTTTDKSKPTFGGLSTRNEMCETFLYHYPKLEVMTCSSLPYMDAVYQQQFNTTYAGAPMPFFESFMENHYDWSNSTERETFKRQLKEAPVQQMCLYNSHNETNPYGVKWWFTKDPESRIIPYAPASTECDSVN